MWELQEGPTLPTSFVLQNWRKHGGARHFENLHNELHEIQFQKLHNEIHLEATIHPKHDWGPYKVVHDQNLQYPSLNLRIELDSNIANDLLVVQTAEKTHLDFDDLEYA